MFVMAVRPESVDRYYAEHLTHRNRKGTMVRSKFEVFVADILASPRISYDHEKKLSSRANPSDFRLPDFTMSYEWDTFCWGHLGMLSTPSHREGWEPKGQWYDENGFLNRLITSEDGRDGSIDATEIDQIARQKILLEG